MTEPRLSYRPMTLDDVTHVLQVENEVYPYPWSERIIQDCIRVGYDCWLALENESIVAHAIVSVAAGESHLLNLSVSKQHQSKGIGKEFIDYLIDIVRDKQATIMMLEVRPSNRQAINCYNASGFNEIGCRKDYYPTANGKEDALLFAREIYPPD
ncbi:MAG: ribosomal-protein-alanine N-acetyltransferase [Gammaproteobacteria bacterium]|jgi:ribosomal-protein-alanine N-acetyltransferase